MKQSTIRRWGPWLALVLLFAIATSLLSWWQFSRRAERVERIDQVIQNYDIKPVPYSDIDWVINPDGTSVSLSDDFCCNRITNATSATGEKSSPWLRPLFISLRDYPRISGVMNTTV